MTTASLPAILAAIIDRELHSLEAQLEALPDDAALWRVAPGISNPVGVLAAHLLGNLQYFIGSLYGGTGYVRDRPAEFARRDRSRAELLAEVAHTRAVVRSTLEALPEARLTSPVPEPLNGSTYETADFLVHLVSHLAYHLGQIDYARRLLTQGGPVRAVPMAELSSARPV